MEQQTSSKPCTNCRTRKVKCDLVRPKCGACSRSMSYHDCEYVDRGSTTVQRLQDQIAGVEARIRTLDAPQAVRFPFSYLDIPRLPASQRMDVPFRQISPNVMERMVENLLANGRSQRGFFLGNTSNMSPALMSTVQLWAIHFTRLQSTNPAPETEYEAPYLANALRNMGSALATGGSPLHAIQGHVLLANYFFRTARIVEAKYHLSAATSLVVARGMHRWSPAMSAEEVRAFWVVCSMDCLWTVADATTSNFPFNTHAVVDVPWLDETQPYPYGTITTFLTLPTSGATALSYDQAAILFERASRLVEHYRPHEHHQFVLAFTSMDALIQRSRQSSRFAAVSVRALISAAAIQLHLPSVAGTDPSAGASRRRIVDAARELLDVVEGAPPLADAFLGTLLAIAFRAAVALEGSGASAASERVLADLFERCVRLMSTFGATCPLIAAQCRLVTRHSIRGVSFHVTGPASYPATHLSKTPTEHRHPSPGSQFRASMPRPSVNRLPNELLSEIFVHTIPIYPQSPDLLGGDSPLQLLKVSRQWKEIALATPLLWRAITLPSEYPVTGRRLVQLVVEWLARSGACSLSINFGFDRESGDNLIQRLVSAILPHRDRWEYLTLGITPQEISLLCGPAPLLRRVHITVEEDTLWDGFIRASAVEPITLTPAGQLTSVRFYDVDCTLSSLPWTQLTTLTLQHRTFAQCLPLLEACAASLLRCRLALCDEDPYALRIVRLPHLHTLVLEADVSYDTEVQPHNALPYLTFLDVPGLRRLQIAGVFLSPMPSAAEYLDGFVGATGCRLEELCVQGPAISSVEELRVALATTVPVIGKIFAREEETLQCELEWMKE
ncbi:hypothetical protein MKEN_01030300 [Mycena kentingensis (nom. inval.)]|nr:hypothetical protein MKEN_01030300 [Mycena kentingensis (nom. inval.)]